MNPWFYALFWLSRQKLASLAKLDVLSVFHGVRLGKNYRATTMRLLKAVLALMVFFCGALTFMSLASMTP